MTNADVQYSEESLGDWSKWLITINFFSASGCIVALKSVADIDEARGLIFFLGIMCFALSVILSSLFVFVLARRRAEKISGELGRFFWLAISQWIFFAVGVFFVLLWVGRMAKLF